MFIGIPSIGLVAVNTYFIEEKHHKHLEEHPPQFTPYEHMKIRTKVKRGFRYNNAYDYDHFTLYLYLCVEILLG